MSNQLGNNGGRSYSFLVKPVEIHCSFTVDATNGLGITGLKGSGVRNVFMHTSTTPTSNLGYLNPNPASGYALIQLHKNYNKFAGEFSAMSALVTGSALAINGSALTAGVPYQIVTVGAGSAGTVTIAPVADSSGSLASTWFRIYDGYGNTFIIWFSVSGTGRAPVGVSGTLVQQSITTSDTAATIGAALVVTLNGLRAQTLQNPGAPNVQPWTASGTTTVTVVSAIAAPLPGGPADGDVATGFTFAVTKNKTNNQNWANIGLPAGVLPAVGASFIATATGDTTFGTSSGTVKAVAASGISSIEIVGDPTLSLSPIPTGGSPHSGGWVMVQFLAPTSSSVTTQIATAPAAGSIIQMSFMVEASSVIINGE